jgi:hypothetical protein
VTGYLCLSLEEAKELYLALGTKAYILQEQGKPSGRVKSLQGRVDNIWSELEHVEKVRSGYTGEEIPSSDAVEGLAAGSVFVPDAG